MYFCLVTKRALFYKLSVLIRHHSYLTRKLFQSSFLAHQVQTVSHRVCHDDVFWWFLCHECQHFLRHCLDLENTTGYMFVCKNATIVSILHPPHFTSLAAGVIANQLQDSFVHLPSIPHSMSKYIVDMISPSIPGRRLHSTDSNVLTVPQHNMDHTVPCYVISPYWHCSYGSTNQTLSTPQTHWNCLSPD